MSGRVRVQYWRAPTICLYSVPLGKGAPSKRESLEPEAVGVEDGLAPTMRARWRSSEIYLDCDKWRPWESQTA